MTDQHQGRIVVAFNRDHEGAQEDPENLARADVVGTARDVAQALTKEGFEVETFGVTDDVGRAVLEIQALEPDVVFNLCESFAGEGRFEAVFPMLLDLNGLAFTGSSAATLLLSVHKDRAKQILQACGVSTPNALCVAGPRVPADFVMPAAVIVKPSREDASVGIDEGSVVYDRKALAEQVERVWNRYQQPVLVEQFIAGREIYVAKLDHQTEPTAEVLPLFEVDFSSLPEHRPHVVTFDAKWLPDSVEYLSTPTRPVDGLPAEVAARLRSVGQAAFTALDVRDYGRIDLRLAEDGTPYVIDINPNCDLSSGAGFAKAARASGQSYEAVIARIARLAMARKDANTIPSALRSRSAHRIARGSSRQSLPRGRSGLRA